MDNEKINVDFRARKTDPEWTATFDKLALKGTEIWFRWLSWALAIGLLEYVGIKSKSVLAAVLAALSTFWLFLYFQAFFYRVDFHGLPWIKSPERRRVASIILSGALAMAAYFTMKSLASAAAKSR